MKVLIDDVPDGEGLNFKFSIMRAIRVTKLSPNLYLTRNRRFFIDFYLYKGHDISKFRSSADRDDDYIVSKSIQVFNADHYYHGYVDFNMSDLFLVKGDYTLFLTNRLASPNTRSFGWVHDYLNPQPAIQPVEEYAYHMPKDLRILGYIRERV